MSFNKFATGSAFLAAFSWLAYAYFFVVARDPLYYSIFLMLGGLFAVKVFTALYLQLKEVDEGFALVALIFGLVGSFGVLAHGGYDLANVINPPSVLNMDLPSQVDPRGLLAFGVTGIGVLKFTYLISKSKKFPNNLSLLGVVSGILLLVIYFGRLIVLDPKNPILLYPILIEGFLINPLWYLWLALNWQKREK